MAIFRQTPEFLRLSAILRLIAETVGLMFIALMMGVWLASVICRT